MNKYELLYIIDNDLTEDAKQAIIDKISEVITSKGTVDSLEKWGTKKFAYPINYKTEGYYVLVNFTAEPSVPADINRLFNITDGAVRCMIVRK